MATDRSFVDFICEQAGFGAALTFRQMFGEYALYLDTRVIALVCDNQLFVKPTEPGRALVAPGNEASPFPGAKPHLRIEDELENRDALRRLFRATADALPAPKAKNAKAAKKAKMAAPSQAKSTKKSATKSTTKSAKKSRTGSAKKGAKRRP